VSSKVIIGDSRRMVEVLDSCVKCIVTSPPYFTGQLYETQYANYYEYLEYLDGTWKECHRVLAKDGLMFVNVGNNSESQFKAHDIAERICDIGFHFVQTVIWVKNHMSPVQGSKHLNFLFEYIFIFSKSKKYSLNRLAIGIPYKDKSNIGRWKIAKQDLKCRGDVWFINYETVQRHEEKMHDAVFPQELPELCIRLATKEPEDTVLDPFLGSGTTLKAAMNLNRNSIGYEINPNYLEIIRKKTGGKILVEGQKVLTQRLA
jgi:site-specific DNA-methyltransferase (adenine-specific)